MRAVAEPLYLAARLGRKHNQSIAAMCDPHRGRHALTGLSKRREGKKLLVAQGGEGGVARGVLIVRVGGGRDGSPLSAAYQASPVTAAPAIYAFGAHTCQWVQLLSYSPSCLEEVFSEPGLPVLSVPGNLVGIKEDRDYYASAPYSPYLILLL